MADQNAVNDVIAANAQMAGNAKEEEAQGANGAGGAAVQAPGVLPRTAVARAEARTVSFQPLQPSPTKAESVDLNFLLDIPLEVTVEIGRTKMLINDLLQLGQGSVIELSKPNTETSFDVRVNDKIVARGEIVVVNDRFGIRLTDIVSPMERVQQIA